MPFMGPIVSVVTSHGWQMCPRKANQSAKPGNATVYGWCMSIAINWPIKRNWPGVIIWAVFQNPVTFDGTPSSPGIFSD